MKIILHKFDPATRIFSGNAFRLGGLEAITVAADTIKEHLPQFSVGALIKGITEGHPHTLKEFREEWLVVEEPRSVGEGSDRVEGYGDAW
jgi:hypothetical protein